MQFTTQKSQQEEFNRLIAEERRIFLKRHRRSFFFGYGLILTVLVVTFAFVLAD